MAEDVAVVLLSNADLSPGNDGPGEGGTEEVAVLIDGVALDGAEDNLLDKLALEVLNHHALGTESEGLLLDLSPVLLLANIGEEAYDSVTLYCPCQHLFLAGIIPARSCLPRE